MTFDTVITVWLPTISTFEMQKATIYGCQAACLHNLSKRNQKLFTIIFEMYKSWIQYNVEECLLQEKQDRSVKTDFC